MVYTRLIVTLPGIYDETMNARCQKDERRKESDGVKPMQAFPLEAAPAAPCQAGLTVVNRSPGQRNAAGERLTGATKLVGIDFDAQAIVTPVLDIVIQDTPVLIVIQTAQQQCRTPFHHPQRLRRLRRHGGWIE